MTNPDDLTFSYVEFERPLHTRLKHSGGEITEIVRRGYIKAMWPSPEGPFYVAWPVEGDWMLELYESERQLREHVAEMVDQAYERARKRTT